MNIFFGILCISSTDKIKPIKGYILTKLGIYYVFNLLTAVHFLNFMWFYVLCMRFHAHYFCGFLSKLKLSINACANSWMGDHEGSMCGKLWKKYILKRNWKGPPWRASVANWQDKRGSPLVLEPGTTRGFPSYRANQQGNHPDIHRKY